MEGCKETHFKLRKISRFDSCETASVFVETQLSVFDNAIFVVFYRRFCRHLCADNASGVNACIRGTRTVTGVTL